ncbi:GTP pyrophosphokinase YjbM [bacterium BMS3Abin07]|nr:GTP pyrophosphokinase YjbM [bacterium BMS3Abin07]
MKIDTKSIIKQYDSNLEKYKVLVKTVDLLLRTSIAKKRIKIHSVTNRIKEVDSLLDKMRRKKIPDPFDEIHDLVGFRVVCLFLSDLDELKNLFKAEFDVFDEDDKIKDEELNIFGYMSVHLKARLKPSDFFEISIDKTILNLPFEIQIITIAQEAWASISHYLDYKKDSDFSDNLKRDFHALSGLFYVADTHFGMLKQEQRKQIIDKMEK